MPSGNRFPGARFPDIGFGGTRFSAAESWATVTDRTGKPRPVGFAARLPMTGRFLVRTILAVVLLAVVLVPGKAEAHPHIFVDCSATAVFDQTGLTGFEQEWVFDEMFSAGMLMDYDSDGNGEFSNEEARFYEQQIFSILKDYNYLTVIRIDGQDQPATSARNFRPSVRNGQLVYRFFTPCAVPFASGPHDVGITVYDPEYYGDMVLLESAVTVDAPPGLEVCSSSVSAPERTYFGCIVPVFINLHFAAP